MFVTNWISTTKIQKISEITNFFRHYFLSRTEVIHEFLANDMISLGENFSEDKVSLSNRKRISEVARVYNTYSEIQKEELKSYICQYSNGDLEYNEQERKFKINDDTDLRLLLFGMQMRFYKQPLNDEVQVATSTTSIRNLK